MIKILHSADWHLDSPLQLDASLRAELAKVPEKIAALCQQEQCDLVLLAGDLFDGAATPATIGQVKQCLADMKVPVFITPGNHDFIGGENPWLTQVFPENVHIFTKNSIESVVLEELNCRIYGGAFTSMDCEGLLDGFCADAGNGYAIGIFHGDPTQPNSPYCPITAAQVQASNLDYLALGHIHKSDSFRLGKTLCAWPGCPMGRGYDEEGEKGVLIVTLDKTVSTRFIPLDTPRFYDLEVEAGSDAAAALHQVLPPVGNGDFYRITFVGNSDPLDLAALQRPEFPNLKLRDKTVPLVDVWSSLGQDTFEGMFFGQLKTTLDDADEDGQRQILLAAQITKKLLEGQEVQLP